MQYARMIFSVQLINNKCQYSNCYFTAVTFKALANWQYWSELKLPVQRIIKYIKKVIQMKKKLFIPVLNVCNFLLTFWITVNFSKRNFSWSLKWNKFNKPKAFIVYNETIDLYWKTHICTIFILTGNSSLILFDASSNTGVKIWLNLHLK